MLYSARARSGTITGGPGGSGSSGTQSCELCHQGRAVCALAAPALVTSTGSKGGTLSMNSFQLSSLPQNPFTRPAFWGRRNELQIIYKHLLSGPPQCCAIIGESFIGKTSLLRYLAESQSRSTLEDPRAGLEFTFVYLDC